MTDVNNKLFLAAGGLLLLAVAGVLYWPVLAAGLVWDDTFLLERYGFLPAAEWLKNAFAAYYVTAEYYRPIPILTFILDAQWGGPEAFAPVAHSVNLAIFLGCVILLALLLWQATGNHAGATLLAVALLVFHPVMIEPVTWISGRCDLLATFFILAGLLIEGRCSRTGLRLGLLSLVMLLALLSKENAIAFPVILMVWRYHLEIKNNKTAASDFWTWMWQRKNMTYILALSGVVGIYTVIRVWGLGDLLVNRDNIIDYRDIGSFVNHALLVGKTFFYYVLLQIFPQYDISALYPTAYPVPLSDYRGWLGLAALTASVVSVILFWRTHKIAQALLVLLVLFVPMSNIRPLVAHDNFIHLRFLLLPLCCTLIFVYPIVFRKVFTQKLVIQKIIAFVLGLWLFTNILNLKITLPLWTNEEALWTWGVQSKPESYIAWNNYASVMIIKREYSQCIEASKKSLEIFSAQSRPYLSLIACSRAIGDSVAARSHADKLLASSLKKEKDVVSGVITELAVMDIEKMAAEAGGVISLEKEQYVPVANALERAMALDPNNKFALTLRWVWSYVQGEVGYSYSLAEKMKKKGLKPEMIKNTIKKMKFIPVRDQENLELMLTEAYEKQ